MGMFDLSLDNLFSDDPKRQAMLTMAMGLLGGSGKTNKNFGADLGNAGLLGMQTYGTAQKAERENRASDLQQLSGAYNLLKQQEFAKMLAAKQAGQSYSPHPMLAPMETKLAQLTGLGNLSGKFGLTAPPAQAPQAPALPAAQASQYSPVVNPEYQAQGPMPRPQQDSSGLGGPAGGIPMEAWLAQDPSGKSYLEQLAKDSQPQNVRPGGSLAVKGPNGQYKSAFYAPQLGPGVMPQRDNGGNLTGAAEIPGYRQASTGIKGAETAAVEEAKFPYRIEMTKQADGREVPTLVSTVVGNPASAMLTGANAPRPARPAVAQSAPSAASGSADPWATMPVRANPQGVGQSSYDAAITKLHADTASRLAEKYGTQADIANKRLALNNQAAELLDRSDTGMGAAFLGDVKNFLVSRIGIPEGDFKNEPAATAALNKDLMQAAVAKAKASYGARMSTNEVNNMLKRGAPNGDMLKSAIKFLLETDNAQAGYDIQQSNHFGEFLHRGGDPMRFEGWYSKTFPLSDVEGKVHLPKPLRFDRNGRQIQE